MSRRRWEMGLAVLGVVMAQVACSSDDGDEQNDDHNEAQHWTYSGMEGPEYWGSLSEDYAVCDSGEHQSPVDFSEELIPEPLDHLAFDYLPTEAAVVDNGHTIVVEFGENENQVIVDEKAHNLVQFHFHAASEHQVEGEGHPLELHLVHQASDGGLAVVGVFLEEGDENEALAEIFMSMADASSDPLPLDLVDLEALLPEQNLGWNYSGSLTTPPCSEGVKWNVFASPLTISAEQLKSFTDLHSGSNRPVQQNKDIDGQVDDVAEAEDDS